MAEFFLIQLTIVINLGHKGSTMHNNILTINIEQESDIDDVRNELENVISFLKEAKEKNAIKSTTNKHWEHSEYHEEKKESNKQKSLSHEDKLKITFETEPSLDILRGELNHILNFLTVKKNDTKLKRHWRHTLYVEIDQQDPHWKQCSVCDRWIRIKNSKPIPDEFPKGTKVNNTVVCDHCAETLPFPDGIKMPDSL